MRDEIKVRNDFKFAIFAAFLTNGRKSIGVVTRRVAVGYDMCYDRWI